MRREIAFPVKTADDIPAMLRWAEAMARKGLPAGEVVCRLGRPRRTLDQNSKLWPMCRDISRQVEWHGRMLSENSWKCLFVASLKAQDFVPGLDGDGFVAIDNSSQELSVQQFSDLIELIYAFGSEREVRWSEPSKRTLEEIRNGQPAEVSKG